MCLQSIVKYTRHIGGLNDLGIFFCVALKSAKRRTIQSLNPTRSTLCSVGAPFVWRRRLAADISSGDITGVFRLAHNEFELDSYVLCGHSFWSTDLCASKVSPL